MEDVYVAGFLTRNQNFPFTPGALVGDIAQPDFCLGILAQAPLTESLILFNLSCQERFTMPVALALLSPVSIVLRAIVCVVVPEASDLDDKGWADLEELVEAALRDRPPAFKRQLRLALYFVQWLPFVRYGRPFTSLDRPQRARFLSFLEDNPMRLVRVGFWGLRTLALLGYYGRPEAAKAIGYAAHLRGWEALG